MFKKTFLCFISLTLFLIPCQSLAQSNITTFSNYWKHRADLFRSLPNPKGEICFLGDSITDGCEWAELTQNLKCTNRGISSDTAWGILKRIKEVYEGKPAKVFLMIGTNDLAREMKVADVRDKIAEIIDTLKSETPQTEIYLQSVFPVIDGMVGNYRNGPVNELNKELVKLAKDKKITWVDIHSLLKNETGNLRKDYTEDGLHLNSRAYYLWFSAIRKYL